MFDKRSCLAGLLFMAIFVMVSFGGVRVLVFDENASLAAGLGALTLLLIYLWLRLMGNQLGRIKVGLTVVLMQVSYVVMLYFDHRTKEICATCGQSETYQMMQVLCMMGVFGPLLLILHYVVDQRTKRWRHHE
jgi:hypothetical protein